MAESTESHKSHNMMTVADYHAGLAKASQEKQEQLIKSATELNGIQSDIESIKSLIKNKQDKLSSSLKALEKLNKIIEGKDKELEVTKKKCKKLMKTLKVNQAEDLASFDPSKLTIEIIQLKRELAEISNDLNIQCIGEAMVLGYIVENEKLRLEALKKIESETPQRIITDDPMSLIKEINEKLDAINEDNKVNKDKLGIDPETLKEIVGQDSNNIDFIGNILKSLMTDNIGKINEKIGSLKSIQTAFVMSIDGLKDEFAADKPNPIEDVKHKKDQKEIKQQDGIIEESDVNVIIPTEDDQSKVAEQVTKLNKSAAPSNSRREDNNSQDENDKSRQSTIVTGSANITKPKKRNVGKNDKCCFCGNEKVVYLLCAACKQNSCTKCGKNNTNCKKCKKVK